MFFKVGAFYQPLGNATKRRCYFSCRLSELFAKSSQNSLFGYFVIKQTRMCNFFYFCCWQFHYPLYNTPHLPSTAGSKERGRLAQLGEHRPYKARVTGSSPVASTTSFEVLRWRGSLVQQLRCEPQQRPPFFYKIHFIRHISSLCYGGYALTPSFIDDRKQSSCKMQLSWVVVNSAYAIFKQIVNYVLIFDDNHNYKT